MKRAAKSLISKEYGSSGGCPLSELFFQLARPLRAVVKRRGTLWLKRLAWHSEFTRGQYIHDLKSISRSRICNDIERYADGGDILDLGCSDGHVGLGLDLKKYSSYTGVDISEIGVKEAFDKCRLMGNDRLAKNTFHADDIAEYIPEKKMDVIMFKDSLYYLKRWKIQEVLNRYRGHLKPKGVFIVEMDNIKRHSGIRKLIRKNFQIIEDSEVTDRDFVVLIFR